MGPVVGMTERPTDYDSLVAAVREEVEFYNDHRGLQFLGSTFVGRLAALLPPAKERVPWWEAKGRTVDGFEIVQVEDGRVGPVVWYLEAPGDPRKAAVDPDGMVEVDAL